MILKTDKNVYCVMLGANKKSGNVHISSASRSKYVVGNKTEALRLYAEMCAELEQFKDEGWTSGIVKMFNPVINPNGSYGAYSIEDNICEYRFGYQDEVKKEDKDGIAIIKKTKAPMRRSSKNRNF